MRKRLIFTITTLTLLPLSFITSATVWYNLKVHSVYYARHIPHKEGENPELAFIIDNLLFIPKPYDQFEYNEFSHEIILKSTHYLGHNWHPPYTGYIFFKGEEGSFVWNEQGKFVYYKTYGQNDYFTDANHQKTAEQELHDIIDPIIELQDEPTLNLQWLFNWVHRERFNK